MKRLVWLMCLASLAGAGCTAAQVSEKAAADRPAGTGSIEVRIEGVESGEGLVYASVYLTADGFPEDKSLAHDYRYAAATPGVMTFRFDEIPAGWFVIAVLHDVNGDEELTLNFLGIPEEDYGFSLNPDSTWGPPPFDESAVYLEGGATQRVIIEL